MKQRIAVAAIALFLLMLTAGWLASESVACVLGDGVRGCTNSRSVSIDAREHRRLEIADRHLASPRPAPEPVGTLHLVACSTTTLSTLIALGVPSAAADAADCGAQIESCLQGTKPTANGPYSASVKVVKQADGSWSFNGNACVPPSGPAARAVTAADVRERVVRMVPPAAVGLAPATVTLVNMQTIAWVATPARRTLGPVSVLGRSVQVQLSFDHVDYDFGDGARLTRPRPGRAYDHALDPCLTAQCPGYDGHVYRATGTHTVRATVAWRASFRVEGGPELAIPGTVSGPPAAAALSVRQARGVLVPDPPGR